MKHTHTHEVKLKCSTNKNSTGRQNNMREWRQGSRILHAVIRKRITTSPFMTSGSHLRDRACKSRTVTEEGTNIQAKGIENALNVVTVQNFVAQRKFMGNQVWEAFRAQGRQDQRRPLYASSDAKCQEWGTTDEAGCIRSVEIPPKGFIIIEVDIITRIQEVTEPCTLRPERKY